MFGGQEAEWGLCAKRMRSVPGGDRWRGRGRYCSAAGGRSMAIGVRWQSVVRTGALLIRRRREIGGDWLVGSPYAATLLIGGLEAEG